MIRKVITIRQLAIFSATLVLSLILVGYWTDSIQEAATRQLDHAALRNQTGLMRAMLLLGADPNARIDSGRICLTGIIAGGTPNIEYHTPLQSAASEGGFEAAKLLLENGARVNDSDGSDTSALWMSALYERADVARLLIEHGASVNGPPHDLTDLTHTTPLEIAAEDGHLDVLKVLVEKGAGNQTSLNLALWEAVRFNHPEAAQFLISKGADVNFDRKGDGQTLLWLAKEDREQGEELVDVLTRAGTKD